MPTSARPTTATDAPVIAVLLDAFNREFDVPSPGVEFLSARLAELLATDRVVAVLAGEPAMAVAVLTFRPALWAVGEVVLLEELYVRPDRRGQGIGTRVLRECIALAEQRGCSEFQINVDESDVDARRFYESHGFRNREPGEDGVMFFYCLDLPWAGPAH